MDKSTRETLDCPHKEIEIFDVRDIPNHPQMAGVYCLDCETFLPDYVFDPTEKE